MSAFRFFPVWEYNTPHWGPLYFTTWHDALAFAKEVWADEEHEDGTLPADVRWEEDTDNYRWCATAYWTASEKDFHDDDLRREATYSFRIHHDALAVSLF